MKNFIIKTAKIFLAWFVVIFFGLLIFTILSPAQTITEKAEVVLQLIIQ